MGNREEILKSFREFYEQGFIEREFEVFGKRWKMRSLNDEEVVWRDKFVPLGLGSDIISAKKVPTLAIAIREIDGVPVSELFKDVVNKRENGSEESSVTEKLARELLNLEEDRKFIFANELRKYLSKLPAKVINQLYLSYTQIEAEEEKVLVELGKSVRKVEEKSRE